MKISLRQAVLTCCLLSLLVSQVLLGQAPSKPPAKPFELTVDSIMRGPRLVGYPPSGVYWSQDSRYVYFRWKRADEPRLKEMSLYVVNRDGSGLRRLSEEEAKQAPPANGELSKDKTKTVFTDEGDIFIYDHLKNARRQITKTTDAETNPHFTFDQKHIYFTRQNNLYVMSLEDSWLEQLTDIRSGAAPSATPKGTDSQEYLKKEERALIDAVRERADQRADQEKKQKEREKRKPVNIPLGRNVINLQLSPNGKHVVATVSEPATGAKNIIVPNYVTESAYTEDIPGRTKVGDVQGRTRLMIIDVETGEAKNVDHGQKLVTVPQIQVTEKTQGESGETKGATQQTAAQPNDRDVQLSQLQWSDDGSHAVLMARAADNKDRWVMLLDPVTGKTRVLANIHDDAWVDGPGANTLGWLPDNSHVYFESERDGWSHLYSVSLDGSAPTQLTSGPFEVSDVSLSPDKTKFYFTSSEGSLFERHLYSMAINGGPRARITSLPGNHQVDVSPDESMLADVFSYSNRPPELFLRAVNANQQTGPVANEQVTTSPVPEFFTHDWIDPRLVSFKARDGATVWARLYVSSNHKPGGPAVLFVHGAGYLQNVHRWWSSYYREYMFNHLLMERGFVVLDIDYRGSAGYGRDWRTGIYRHMGGKDLTDHVDAVNYLVKEFGVDAKRVGLYGGSYGGFITLMGMFTQPDVFAAGAALRPVTDWAHYNNPYTSNILNLPQSDAEAYKRSSPIYFANGLKGALLICHGMVDVNVNFQDTVRLVEKLIELRKENWEVAPYPVEDHGFEREESWADEYKRILKLFTVNLKPEVRVNLPTTRRRS
ncbi:MAG TPA: alpha/beta fold hydrolase [Pyrinomonadaceae bacterium]